MSLPTRHMLIGMFLGAACATAIAMTGHGMVIETFADEVEAPAFDVSKLVKFNDRQYAVEAEDWVSSEPLSTVRVKKVEAGVVSYVTITTTETGTYSTDAMFSKHVQYPGITVTQKPEWSPANRFSFWSNGVWSSFTSGRGGSFFHFRGQDHSVSTRDGITCVRGASYRVCS